MKITLQKYFRIFALLFVGIMIIGYNSIAIKFGIDTLLAQNSGSDPIIEEAHKKSRLFKAIKDDQHHSVLKTSGSENFDLDMAIAKFTAEEAMLARLARIKKVEKEKESLAKKSVKKMLRVTQAKKRVKKIVKVVKVVLPKLSGVLKYMRSDGKITQYALIDGKTLCKNEKIKGFTITRINEDGVNLTKAGKKWVVFIPKISHTVSQIQGVSKSELSEGT